MHAVSSFNTFYALFPSPTRGPLGHSFPLARGPLGPEALCLSTPSTCLNPGLNNIHNLLVNETLLSNPTESLFGDPHTKSQIDQLEMDQRRGARFVTGSGIQQQSASVTKMLTERAKLAVPSNEKKHPIVVAVQNRERLGCHK